uniref:Uncharacterized protein n=1 Tax=Echinococcus canadensis TaxID=519352 RepID=A0A915EY45_9CEST
MHGGTRVNGMNGFHDIGEREGERQTVFECFESASTKAVESPIGVSRGGVWKVQKTGVCAPPVITEASEKVITQHVRLIYLFVHLEKSHHKEMQFWGRNLSELSGPHLSLDDFVTPDEGYRTANHHLPSIPQGKELIIPVNAPPCYLHTTDVDATTVFTEFCARQTARLGSSGEAFSTTVEVKEQLITVRETKRRPSCSSKGSVTTSTDASEATSMDLSNSSSSSSSSTATTITTTPTTTSSSAKSAASSTKQRCLSEVSPQPTSTANPTVLQRFNFSPKPHGFFGRLRLFSHNSVLKASNDAWIETWVLARRPRGREVISTSSVASKDLELTCLLLESLTFKDLNVVITKNFDEIKICCLVKRDDGCGSNFTNLKNVKLHTGTFMKLWNTASSNSQLHPRPRGPLIPLKSSKSDSSFIFKAEGIDCLKYAKFHYPLFLLGVNNKPKGVDRNCLSIPGVLVVQNLSKSTKTSNRRSLAEK